MNHQTRSKTPARGGEARLSIWGIPYRGSPEWRDANRGLPSVISFRGDPVRYSFRTVHAIAPLYTAVLLMCGAMFRRAHSRIGCSCS